MDPLGSRRNTGGMHGAKLHVEASRDIPARHLPLRTKDPRVCARKPQDGHQPEVDPSLGPYPASCGANGLSGSLDIRHAELVS